MESSEVDNYYVQGHNSLKRRDWDAARQAFSKCLELNPSIKSVQDLLQIISNPECMAKLKEFESLGRELQSQLLKLPSVVRRPVEYAASSYMEKKGYQPQYDHGISGELSAALKMGVVRNRGRIYLNPDHKDIAPIIMTLEGLKQWVDSIFTNPRIAIFVRNVVEGVINPPNSYCNAFYEALRAKLLS